MECRSKQHAACHRRLDSVSNGKLLQKMLHGMSLLLKFCGQYLLKMCICQPFLSITFMILRRILSLFA